MSGPMDLLDPKKGQSMQGTNIGQQRTRSRTATTKKIRGVLHRHGVSPGAWTRAMRGARGASRVVVGTASRRATACGTTSNRAGTRTRPPSRALAKRSRTRGWLGDLVPLKSAKVLAFGADEIARRCSFWCHQMRKGAERCHKTAIKTATKRLNPENLKIAPTSRSIQLCLELPHTR